MTGYQECDQRAPMVEEGGEGQLQVQPKPMQWRRLGLSLVVMCTIGAMTYSQSYSQRTQGRAATRHERLLKFQRKLISAFERHLSESTSEDYLKLKDRLSFIPDGTKAAKLAGTKIHLETGEEKTETTEPAFIITFAAKTEKTEDLRKSIHAIFAQMAPSEEALDQIFKFEANEETEEVVITMTPPSKASGDGADGSEAMQALEEDAEKEEEEMAGQELKIEASLTMGAKLEDMVKSDASIATAHGGIDIEFNTRILYSMVQLMQDEEEELKDQVTGEGEGEGEKFPLVDFLRAFSSIGGQTTIKYRAEKVEKYFKSFLKSEAQAETLTFQQLLMMGVAQSPVPPAFLKSLGDLKEFANGLKSIALHGLKGKAGPAQVVMTFENFGLTPTLSFVCDKLEEMQQVGDGDEDEETSEENSEE